MIFYVIKYIKIIKINIKLNLIFETDFSGGDGFFKVKFNLKKNHLRQKNPFQIFNDFIKFLKYNSIKNN